MNQPVENLFTVILWGSNIIAVKAFKYVQENYCHLFALLLVHLKANCQHYIRILFVCPADYTAGLLYVSSWDSDGPPTTL